MDKPVDEIRYARITQSSYENVIADCPWCGSENIFNRMSDLEDASPIASKEVQCLNGDCRRPFRVTGDLVSAAYEMLVFDCYESKKEKRYSSCILNLAQAYEMFFSLYLRISLLYRPFARQGGHDLNQLNSLAATLYETVKKYLFKQMRNAFLNLVLDGNEPSSLDEAESIISRLPELAKRSPADKVIAAYPDGRLADLLKRVEDTKILELRNRVVHHRAYRPRRTEVEHAVEETRSTLFPLKLRLDLNDDINWYLANT